MENTKISYCKKCGSMIDAGKKCTGCGKQYFRFSFAYSLLSTLFALSFIAFIYMAWCASVTTQEYDDLSRQYNSKCKSYEEKLSDLRESFVSQQEDLANVKEINAEYEATVRYYESFVALTTETGTKYHKYNCHHLNNVQMIYYGFIEDLKKQGYEPCLDCH